MAAPAPKKKTFGPGKTAAIQASRERTKAQTAPGVDYKKDKAEKESKSYGGYYGGAKESEADKKQKRKDRLAKMREMTAKIRSSRQAMSSKLNPFRRK